DLSMRLGIDFREAYVEVIDGLHDMADDGLVRLDASGLAVTDAGRLFIRNIAMRFDPEIETSSAPRYSRTI
ncbi:MAG: coproporphyrinogen III oxidase, partial [Verrucomicrobiota bacterium]|nr:coproporphyrinogen III oxidase [Verrucomicrobiota bacterium]